MKREVKALILFGFSIVSYYAFWWTYLKNWFREPSVIMTLKFGVYMSVFLWLSSGFYLRACAMGEDVESLSFWIKIIKMNLLVYGILFLSEITLWIN